jgi:hypothetical protein
MIRIAAPIIAGLHNVELHLQKSGIEPSSANFNPAVCWQRHQAASGPKPPSPTPVVAGLCNFKLHPRKGSINPSSLASFDLAPLALADGHVCKPQSGVHCATPRRQDDKLPSHPLVVPAVCCIASSHVATLSLSHCNGWLLHLLSTSSCCAPFL